MRAFLGRRTGVTAAQADLDAATAALTDGKPGADEDYATRWNAGSRSAAPTSTSGWTRWSPTSG